MARPERNTVDYFPFICDEGKKMFYLEETYGNDGFAVFVKLLRELAKTEYHYLDLSNKMQLMFLSAKCKVSVDVLKSIINDLVELEKFDAVLWNENSIIWCQDFINSIQDAYKKRNNKCISYSSLLTLLQAKGIRKRPKSKSKGDVNTQRKEKDSKEDKSIEDESIEVFGFYNSTIHNMPKAKELSTARKKAINARIKEHSLELCKDAIVIAANSDFLNGKSEKGWKANIDWIFNPNNFVKIIEGNYNNTQNNGQPQQTRSDEAKESLFRELEEL